LQYCSIKIRKFKENGVFFDFFVLVSFFQLNKTNKMKPKLFDLKIISGY
jgi:hypothetical protein